MQVKHRTETRNRETEMNEKTEFRNAWMIFTKRLFFLQHIVRMPRRTGLRCPHLVETPRVC